MVALKRVTRYLKGTRHFVDKLELDTDVDKHVTGLDGFSDSDWAGSTDRKSQSSGVLFVDGAPLCSFSRRQSLIATISGMAMLVARLPRKCCWHGCADVLWLSSRSIASHGKCGIARNLLTRGRREGQIVGSMNVVVATGGQSENTHTQDSRRLVLTLVRRH